MRKRQRKKNMKRVLARHAMFDSIRRRDSWVAAQLDLVGGPLTSPTVGTQWRTT